MNSSYTKYYKPDKLVAKVQGAKCSSANGIIRAAATLFVLLQQPSIPIWAKATIVGALGYFICPIDVVPDFLPMGLADDLMLLTFTLGNLSFYRNEDTALEVENMMARWS